jgi:hypothetical protein
MLSWLKLSWKRCLFKQESPASSRVVKRSYLSVVSTRPVNSMTVEHARSWFPFPIYGFRGDLRVAFILQMQASYFCQVSAINASKITFDTTVPCSLLLARLNWNEYANVYSPSFYKLRHAKEKKLTGDMKRKSKTKWKWFLSIQYMFYVVVVMIGEYTACCNGERKIWYTEGTHTGKRRK